MFESLGRVGSLRRGILGVRETFALSLALLALVMASSLATSGAAALAGGAVPLVYALAGLGSLCLASVIIRFTRPPVPFQGPATRTRATTMRAAIVPPQCKRCLPVST